jgi:hypothetical protein
MSSRAPSQNLGNIRQALSNSVGVHSPADRLGIDSETAKADISAVLAGDGFSLLTHQNDHRITHNYDPVGRQRLIDSLNS